MDNLNFAQLMPLITKLSEDPAAMKAISGLMGAMNGQKNESPPPKNDAVNDPLASLFSIMNGASSDGNGVTRNQPNGKNETEKGAQTFGKLFGSQEEIKNRIMLLNAVRPYLSESRREKLETVIKMLRLAELGTLGSLLK